jgi:hypothetical protein
MRRFFNIGEANLITDEFIWDDAVESRSKEDGSLITLFNFEGEWMVKTRASWADQHIGENLPRWDDLVWSLIKLDAAAHLDIECTYVFELCTMFNQVVRLYPVETLFLLTIIETRRNKEWFTEYVDQFAFVNGVKRPAKIDVTNEFAVREYITTLEHTDGTAEGLVLKDRNGLRIKVKSSTYLAYSRLGGNGNIAMDRNLIPLILANEQDEAIAIFPSIEPRIRELQEIINCLWTDVAVIWHKTDGMFGDDEKLSQKDFALAVLKSPLSSLLFLNRKDGGDHVTLWKMFLNSSDLLVKVIGGDK